MLHVFVTRALVQHMVRTVQSHFFTVDVAKRRDGGWLIAELGDEQVVGLPERVICPPSLARLPHDP